MAVAAAAAVVREACRCVAAEETEAASDARAVAEAEAGTTPSEQAPATRFPAQAAEDRNWPAGVTVAAPACHRTRSWSGWQAATGAAGGSYAGRLLGKESAADRPGQEGTPTSQQSAQLFLCGDDAVLLLLRIVSSVVLPGAAPGGAVRCDSWLAWLLRKACPDTAGSLTRIVLSRHLAASLWSGGRCESRIAAAACD